MLNTTANFPAFHLLFYELNCLLQEMFHRISIASRFFLLFDFSALLLLFGILSHKRAGWKNTFPLLPSLLFTCFDCFVNEKISPICAGVKRRRKEEEFVIISIQFFRLSASFVVVIVNAGKC